jgi:hypothetical protein
MGWKTCFYAMLEKIYRCKSEEFFFFCFSRLFSLLMKRDRRCIWPYIKQQLVHLKQKCDHHEATFEDLQVMILKLFFYSNKGNILIDNNWKLRWTSLWYGLSRKVNQWSKFFLILIMEVNFCLFRDLFERWTFSFHVNCSIQYL